MRHAWRSFSFNHCAMSALRYREIVGMCTLDFGSRQIWFVWRNLGAVSDSRRTGLSVSHYGASIKNRRACTRPSAGGSTEKKTASSHHILTEKIVPSESAPRRKSSPYLRTRGTSARLPASCCLYVRRNRNDLTVTDHELEALGSI